MKAIYNRIGKERMTLVQANNLLEMIDSIDSGTDLHKNYISDIYELCEILNSRDFYGCGTCFYVIDSNASFTDILVTIYGGI